MKPITSPSLLRPASWLALCLLLSQNALALELGELSELLNRTEAGSVPFVEQQYRKALKTPIERSGELLYTPPNRFEKHVITPSEERYVISGDTLNIELPGRKNKQLSTRNQPILRGLMLSFQSVVSGRLHELATDYRTELSGTHDDWRLQLTPSRPELARYIAKVVVTGQRNTLRQFEVIEVSGDRTVTRISASPRISASH